MKRPDKLQILAFILIICSAVSWGKHYYQIYHSNKIYDELARQARETKPGITESEIMESESMAQETVDPMVTGIRNVEDELPYTSPIDFESLWNINPDVVGWIQIEGTQIDYPILYDGHSNEKYLHTDMEGKESVSGAIYLDMDDTPDFTALHNIIYGHHMKNGSMFKDVVKYKNQEFFDNHRDITLYLPDREMKLKAFACIYNEPDGIRRKTKFQSQQEFQDYIKKMTDGSCVYVEPEYEVEQLFSLVTCSYEFQNARTILYCYPVPDTLQGNNE